jgi:DnaJ-domain-containing protein 1
MIFVPLGLLVLAGLVWLGRRPMMARAPVRWAGIAVAVATAGAAIYDAMRGGWIGGSILLTAALWLLRSSLGRRAPVATDGGMSASDAASILGVAPTAPRAEIEAAYRRLMLRVHPDHGGAAGLAAQLNAARAVLLGPKR